MSKRANRKRRHPDKEKAPIEPQENSSQAQAVAKSVMLAQHEEMHFSGPLPPPEILVAYNQIVPDSAEKIIEQFIRQGQHRMELERLVITSDVKRANWGLVAGFILALLCIAGSFYLISLGFEIAGIAVVLASLASLIGAFIYGTHSRKKERVEKTELLIRDR